jgi:uncharacterized protein YndB with AHSA1/START domain
MSDNKPNDNELVISRVFDAPREAVWKAWTDPEQIKRWWGPKDFTAPQISVDLRVGGKYHYCMHGAPAPGMPAQDFWSAGIFKEIVPQEKIVVTDYFSDKDGNKLSPADFGLSADFPAESVMTITFTDEGDKTKLSITYPLPDSAASREAIISSGMEQGWNQSLNKLGEALKQ